MEDTKIYNFMENVLQNINKHFISLPDDEIKRNNLVLEAVLTAITTKMKEKSELFKNLFSTVFCGGSYYDGLKVGNPDEFDLDLLFTLPKYAKPELTISNAPGFMHVQLKEFDKFQKQPESSRYPILGNSEIMIQRQVQQEEIKLESVMAIFLEDNIIDNDALSGTYTFPLHA